MGEDWLAALMASFRAGTRYDLSFGPDSFGHCARAPLSLLMPPGPGPFRLACIQHPFLLRDPR